MYRREPVKIPFKLIGILSAIIVLVITVFTLWETNNAGFIAIRQMPITGILDVYSQPGVYFQGGGNVEYYKQVSTVSFGSPGEGQSSDAGPIDVRFNDSGKAKVFGNARFELPAGNKDQMLEIHRQYRSYNNLVDTLLEKVTAEAIVLTGSMLSSEDTYAGGKAEFLRLALDQLENGKYQTDVREEETEDPLTKERRRVKKVSIRLGQNGVPLRLENPLEPLGIKVLQLVIDRDFEYEQGILAQIQAQREAFMQTVTARAEAQRASQEAITAKAKGEANVATAKYEREVEKIKALVEAAREKEVATIAAERQREVAEIEKQQAEIEAQKRLEVAKLDKQAAEETKQKEILLGEGESQRRKLVMEADGALQAKLLAYVDVQRAYAEAIQNYRGNWVPLINMAPGTETPGNGAEDLINLLKVKTAKDLAVDVGFSPVMNKQ